MKIVQAFLGAMALATVSVNPGSIAAQGLPELRTRVDALENKVEMLEDALSGVTDSVADLESRADSFESTSNSLEGRVDALEERLEALEGALAGLTCPEGQFVRGFNTSGDLLCAAPAPQENPDETIVLPNLAADLRAKLNELLVTNTTLSDVAGQSGDLSYRITDLVAQLTCPGQCVPTLEARTTGDGKTLVVAYDFDGIVEITGAAEIAISGVPGSFDLTFVVTYEDVAAGFSAEIDQANGSVVSVESDFSPSTTDVDVIGGGVLGALLQLVENLNQTQARNQAKMLLDDLHAIALSELEPINLPGAGI